jgi:hypothetical protein
MSFSPPPMAIHNSMAKICCYAAPIAMEITPKISDLNRVFNTHACWRQLILP